MNGYLPNASLFIYEAAVILVLGVLLLPGFIAMKRKHKNFLAIAVCGVLLWPVGLIWSLTNNVDHEE